MAKDPSFDPTRSNKFPLKSVADLQALPKQRWLIKPLFEIGAFVVLYGPPGEGKSFLALDWALSVSVGRPWMGHDVVAGCVVYVTGEGGRGVQKRVAAWMLAHGVEAVQDMFFVLQAVQLLNEEDLDVLLARLGQLSRRPALIIFDTFARCFVGGDENMSRDVGQAVEAVRSLIEQKEATVLLVHHTGKGAKDVERGSNALRGAADVMIRLRRDVHQVITLANDKQKDADEFEPIALKLKPVLLGADEDGEEITSCVLEAPDLGSLGSESVGGGLFQALEALRQFPDGASSASWQQALAERLPKAVPKKTFHNWRKSLLARGSVEPVINKKAHYRAKDAERSASATTVPIECQGTEPE